jgi:predicted ester cyclase
MSIKPNEPQQATGIGSAEHNRIAASRWIDAFNARDDAAEAAARTAGYIAHAPQSIEPAALDSEAWIEFLAVFLEGFPDLHLEVLDSSADERMVAQRILFTGMHTGTFRGLPATGNNVRFSGLEINRMVDGRVAEHWFQLVAVTLFEQLGLHIVPGPRLLARLLASPVRRLFGMRQRKVAS